MSLQCSETLYLTVVCGFPLFYTSIFLVHLQLQSWSWQCHAHAPGLDWQRILPEFWLKLYHRLGRLKVLLIIFIPEMIIIWVNAYAMHSLPSHKSTCKNLKLKLWHSLKRPPRGYLLRASKQLVHVECISTWQGSYLSTPSSFINTLKTQLMTAL